MGNPAADYPAEIHTPIDVSLFGGSALGGTDPNQTELAGKVEQELVATQTKLGLGVSTPAIGLILQGTGDGESAWLSLGPLGGYFNVKDYGAAGDGSTNDTAAIQATFDAAHTAGGGTVFFPTGTYIIDQAITFYTGVSALGEGSEATIISQTSTTEAGFYGMDIASVSIESLLIEGPSSGSGVGINFAWSSNGNVPFLDFRDVWVRDFGGDGIAIETPIVSHFDRVISQGNGGDGFNLYHAGTSTTFTSCWARDNVQAGYHFYESVYIKLNACASDGNGLGYLVENAQSIQFAACGCESTVATGGDYDGTAFKISNSSVIGLYDVWITANDAVAIWVTNGSIATEIFGAADNSPAGGATAFVQTDVSTNTTLSDVHNTTANSYSPGTVTVLNDGANGMLTKQMTVKDSSGSMIFTAASDGGDYNVEVDTTGVLAFFGSGGQVLNIKLLDGYLELDPLTATTVPYLDSNKRFASSAVTPTELGYVSGVTSAIQTQLGGKQATITFGTGVLSALGDNIGSAGAPIVFNGAAGTPSSLTLTNATGLPLTGLSGLGTGVATALGDNVGSAGAFVVNGGAGGTPSSLTLTNATGLPVGSLTGLGTGIETWLATPSSANLASAMTDESGTGVLTFGTNPTIAITGGVGGLTLTGQTAMTLQDSTDATKQAQFIMATIATGTTRAFTFPNAAGTFALANAAQTFSSVQTFSAAPLITVNGAGTNTLTTILTITENSSGTPAAGFGSQILLRLKDSTTTSENAAAINWAWSTATHGSTVSYLQIQTVSGGTTLAEVGRFALSSATVGNLTLGVAGTSDGNLTLSGHTSGATTLIPLAAASGTLTLPSATDTLIGKATTDTLTNKTFDTAGTGNSFSINGVAATANTGTGSVVRATSPTIASLTTSTLLTANTELDLVGSSGTLHFTAASDGGDYNIFSSNGSQVLAIYGSASNTLSLNLLDGSLQIGGTVAIAATGVFFPVQAATVSAPSYIKGGIYFDTTLNKLRVGGATGWETITSA